ncbi:MAG: hypothetical protein HY304_05910 [candidate division Zixibacteria bacterium]|nr:hypothetical protein [candidate division Zixibacteria bacterium]
MANLHDIVSRTPAIAWLAYSIHGGELSGVDASLWVAYHLVACNDPATRAVRDSIVTLIDPIQNPDGRERYLASIFAFNGRVPNRDGQSLQHDGFWPWGRANHYLFDMNRDWLPLVHPETKARVTAMLHWNPQVAVDAHEMGSQSTYLFSPGREPMNPNITPTLRKWWDTFGADQGAAFDRHGWSYYTGDWNEEWYPGYSSWDLFIGTVSILYEQSGVAGSGVKRADGTVQTYARAVAQQAVSSLANLGTTAAHRRELLADFARFYSDVVTGKSRANGGAYILAPSGNPGREREFLTSLLGREVEIEKTTAAFSASVTSSQGEKSSRNFPAGTYLISLDQPKGLLVHALLEFDPHLKPEFLEKERRELEKGNGTQLYEVSGWSLAEGFDLDVSYTAARPSVGVEPVTAAPAPGGGLKNPDAAYGFLLTTLDDQSMVALTQMLEMGLQVHAATKPFVYENASYAAGTLLLRRTENAPDLPQRLTQIAQNTGVEIIGAASNHSSTRPDLGSDYFVLLRSPRIGLFMGSGLDFTSCGFDWYLLDNKLGIRQSLLEISQLSNYDLSAYNVLVLPSGGNLKSRMGSGGIDHLKDWIKAGGTLIAVGDAAFFCADSANSLSDAREKGAVLDKLPQYDQDYRDTRAAFTATVDTDAVWRGAPQSVPKKDDKGREKPDLDSLKRTDARARLFAPEGVIMRLDLNPEHWLCFGTGGRASAMLHTSNALVAKDPVAVAARLADAPQMRLSGLLWPEARERWAKTAYATRESVGKGQIILFADEPFFRAYFHGTKRLLENAVLLGPGLGTEQPPPW